MKFKAVTSGGSVDDALTISQTLLGNSLKPLSPVNLTAISGLGGGFLFKWTRRSRLSPGLRSYSDVPLGEETERYLVEVYNGSTLKRSWHVDKTTRNPIMWAGLRGAPSPLAEGGLYDNSAEGSAAVSGQDFSGDVTVEFTTIDPANAVGFPQTFSIQPGTPIDFRTLWYWEETGVFALTGYPETESGLVITAAQKETFAIETTGGIARYYYQGRLIYTSLILSDTVPRRVFVDLTGGQEQGIFSAHITGIATNAYYSPEAYVEDFVAPPSTIKVRVSQMSSVVGRGAYVELTITV